MPKVRYYYPFIREESFYLKVKKCLSRIIIKLRTAWVAAIQKNDKRKL